MRWLLYILILIFVALNGCEISRTIDYDATSPPDKLVITGFIGLDNRAEAYISISNPPLSTDEKVIRQVDVSLYEDGNICDNKTLTDDPLYLSSAGFKPGAGKTYSISARADGYPEAVSEVESFPTRVAIDSVNYYFSPQDDILIQVFFTDPSDENFYAVKIIKNYNDTLVCDTDTTYSLFVLPGAFSDKLFNSGIGQYDTRQNLVAGRYENKTFYYNRADIVLFTISKAGYNFCRSLDEADYTNGDMFTAPTIIESNIKNGYGIFMAYATDTIQINLEK